MPRFLTLLFLVGLFAQTGGAFVLHVPADQPTVQQGLDAAQDGDTVRVAAGVYYENLRWPEYTASIKLLGESENACILDGDRSGSVITIERIIHPVDTTTVISGFTIRNGLGQQVPEQSFGGGIYLLYASPRIENVTLCDNLVNRRWSIGAGVYGALFSCPRFRNVTFFNNRAIADCTQPEACWGIGGGLSLSVIPGSDCAIVMENVVFMDNLASAECNTANPCFVGGGALSVTEAELRIENALFFDNLAQVTCNNSTGCESSGGAMDLSTVDLFLKKAQFVNNAAFATCSPGAPCGSYGGAIASAFRESALRLDQVTFAGNRLMSDSGGGSVIDNWGAADLQLTRSILWDNQAPQIQLWGTWQPDTIYFECNDIEGAQAAVLLPEGWPYEWDEVNLDADPLFCDPPSGDYRIRWDSPCMAAPCGIIGPGLEPCAQSVDQSPLALPEGFILHPPSPNPFNSITRLRFTLPRAADTRLAVYTLRGSLAAVIHEGPLPAGEHTMPLRAEGLASGLYLVQLQAEGKRLSRKVLLLR